MNILLTNYSLAMRAGTETWTMTMYDYLSQNHNVDVFVPMSGENTLIPNARPDYAKKYDLGLINHNICLRELASWENIEKRIFTSHGIYPDLEQPLPGADIYVSVSEEVQDNLREQGFDSCVIRNPINTDYFKSGPPINDKLENILFLNNHAYKCSCFDVIKDACKEYNFRILSNHKKSVLDQILWADLVITTGRGCYESLACKRNVLVMGHFGADGMVTWKNISNLRKNNCSGRAYAHKWDASDIRNEFAKYQPDMNLREYIILNNDVREIVRQYLLLANTKKRKAPVIELQKSVSDRKISVILPVIRRDKAARCLEAIQKNAGLPKSQYEIVTEYDQEEIGCPRMVAQLTKKTNNDLIMFLGDDTVPQAKFMRNALHAMDSLPGGWGVVGLNSDGNDHAHWLAHKNILNYIEGEDFFPLEYKHCFCDDELKDVAIGQGCWVYAEDSIIEHKHPIFETADIDEHYDRVYSDEIWNHDLNTYRRRKIDRLRRHNERKLAIAIPLTDTYNFTQFTTSYSILQKPKPYEFLFPSFPGQIDAIRNNLVEQAFRIGCTDIVMLDTDQVYNDPDTIIRLMKHHLPVVGARVHRRYPPFDPLCLRGEIGKLETVPDEEVEESIKTGMPIEVDATGCGCILYDLRVFTKMERPWFKLAKGKKGQPVGEDIGCCQKLKDLGYKIYVDCSLDVKHLTLLALDWGFYKLFSKILKAKIRSERKEMVENGT